MYNVKTECAILAAIGYVHAQLLRPSCYDNMHLDQVCFAAGTVTQPGLQQTLHLVIKRRPHVSVYMCCRLWRQPLKNQHQRKLESPALQTAALPHLMQPP